MVKHTDLSVLHGSHHVGSPASREKFPLTNYVTCPGNTQNLLLPIERNATDFQGPTVDNHDLGKSGTWSENTIPTGNLHWARKLRNMHLFRTPQPLKNRHARHTQITFIHTQNHSSVTQRAHLTHVKDEGAPKP